MHMNFPHGAGQKSQESVSRFPLEHFAQILEYSIQCLPNGTNTEEPRNRVISWLLRPSKSFLITANRNKRVKNFLLGGVSPAHMLRVPLDAQAEGMPLHFQAFDESFWTFRGDFQVLPHLADRLVVDTVDFRGIAAHDLKQPGILLDLYRVRGTGAGLEIGVLELLRRCNVLVQRPALAYIQELEPPADREDRFPGFQKFRID